MTTALVFPGQGSQAVGMGKELAENFPLAKAVFEEVDEALSDNLSKIMWAGPEDALTLTSNTQPALMAHSIAAYRVLAQECGLKVADCQFVAGHSLGEYSALCAAGTFDLATTARLLRTRGNAMQAAVPVGEGGMAAILGLTIAEVEKNLAATGGVCEVANDNCPGQVVISGTSAAVEAAMAALKEAGAKRALALPVSAPFHSSLMQPAAQIMADALAAAEASNPAVPVVANVSAEPVTDPGRIRELLVQQVTGRVRWTESVQAMNSAGVMRFVEIGSGKVLSGLIRKIAKEAETFNVGTPDDVAKVSA